LKDRVLVVSVDAIADRAEMVKEAPRRDVFQDAQARAEAAVTTAVEIVRANPTKSRPSRPSRLVTAENVAQFRRE